MRRVAKPDLLWEARFLVPEQTDFLGGRVKAHLVFLG